MLESYAWLNLLNHYPCITQHGAITAFPREEANSEAHSQAPTNHRGLKLLLQPQLNMNLLTQGSQQKTGQVQVNITLLPIQL